MGQLFSMRFDIFLVLDGREVRFVMEPCEMKA